MKKILLISLILIGCAMPHQSQTARKSNVEIRVDGRNYRAKLRNERKENNSNNKFNWKMYSDSLDNALKMQKQRTAQLEDSLRFNKRKYGTELRQLNKQIKQEEKTERKWAKWINGFMIGIAIGIITTILVSWWIGVYRKKDKNTTKCVNCGDKVNMISSGEICPHCCCEN
jgi:hypothetical protein